MSEITKAEGVLTAPYVLEYTYKRTVGPIIGGFLTGLRDGVVLGAKTADGRLIVPAVEYDPVTSEALTELVEVGQSGVVTTWAWVADPRPNHPLQKPFAFALIQLDGADTGMLHAVDAGHIDAMKTGMRVSLRWQDERVGRIQDIACFVPEGSS